MASIDSTHHPPRVSTVTACGCVAAAGGAVDIFFSRNSKLFCNTEDSEVPGQVNHYYYIHYTYTYIRLGICNRVSKSITTQVNDGTRINFEFPEV